MFVDKETVCYREERILAKARVLNEGVNMGKRIEWINLAIGDLPNPN